VRELLRDADLAFGNLEGPLVDENLPPVCTKGGIAEKSKGQGGNTCFSFRMPTKYGSLLHEAGFDVVSVANNHAYDFGEAGRASTLKILGGLGIAAAGRPSGVAHLVVAGTKIDFVAFATETTSDDLRDLEAARTLVASSVATADVVIVSFHGGAEGPNAQHVPEGSETFWGEDRGAVKTFARAMIDAGADLVLGHGPHVVRGMEVRGGRLVAYSLGNFATYGAMNLSGPMGVSLALEVRMRADGTFVGGRIHPIVQVSPGGPRPDPSAAIVKIVDELSKSDFGTDAVRVDANGTLLAP
jgi:poly-gamma-glutamate capsule biosynthesis protein CapA/YwtB (metallophosphatase superfamily)